MKTKCYVGNLDGRREGCVYASSQKAAAVAAGCSVYVFRQYWNEIPMPGPIDEPREVDTLYVRLYGSSCLGPWFKEELIRNGSRIVMADASKKAGIKGTICAITDETK